MIEGRPRIPKLLLLEDMFQELSHIRVFAWVVIK